MSRGSLPFCDATTGFPAKWRLRNERRNSILMTRHYPDLGSASDWLNQISHAARPIRSTTQIWVVTRHQYGISALVSQTSFSGKPVVASLNVDCFRRLLSRLPESLLAGYVKSSLHAHYLVTYNFTNWFEGLHWDQGVPLCYAGACLI